MANRSFIYTINIHEQGDIKNQGLSEYPYEVHPLYLLMVSCESKVILSKFVEEENKTAIIGDFEKGKNLVLKFFTIILTYDKSFDNDSFKSFVATSIEFLNRRNAGFVILENFEIAELGETNFVAETFEELKIFRQEIENLYNKHLNGSLIDEDIYETTFYNNFIDVCTQWGQVETEEIDWIDFWIDTLYYKLKN